jgi:hypothetical protein
MLMTLLRNECVKIKSIDYLCDLSEVNPEHDNLDVHVTLEDGREFTFVVATPNNVFWCMENEGIDYFFGEPMIFVKCLTAENIEKAVKAIVAEDNGRWLKVYG